MKDAKSPHLERFIIFGALAFLAVLHLLMVWRFEVNWDEFYRLADIYKWKEGTLGSVLQTNYVYAFGWLENIHPNEVYQIIAARSVMFALLAYSCTLIYLLGRYFFDASSAGLTLIAFLGFSFVFRHATSFRVDLPVLALSLTAIAILVLSRRKTLHYFMAGICLGIAGSVSIKAGLFIPTTAILLLLYWWRSEWTFRVLIQSVSMGFVALLTFSLLIYFHNQSLPNATVEQGFSGYAVSTAILGYGLFPQSRTLFFAIDRNMIYAFLFLAGCVFSLLQLKNTEGRFKVFLVLTIAILPLLSLVFYVHTFAYFYTTLLATGSLMVGASCFYLKQLYNKSGVMLALILLVSAVPMIMTSLKQTNAYQIQISDVVHEMFPEPVAYIDRASQISSFPKQGLFMSNVLMDEYSALEQPIMKDIFDDHSPEFLLANITSLDLDMVRADAPTRRLLPEDEALLIENFIHHWGPIYVPGKIVDSGTKNAVIRIELPGIYTVVAASDVLINGVRQSMMEAVYLDAGDHIIDLQENDRLTLRWGDGLYHPDFEPLGDTVFRGF